MSDTSLSVYEFPYKNTGVEGIDIVTADKHYFGSESYRKTFMSARWSTNMGALSVVTALADTYSQQDSFVAETGDPMKSFTLPVELDDLKAELRDDGLGVQHLNLDPIIDGTINARFVWQQKGSSSNYITDKHELGAVFDISPDVIDRVIQLMHQTVEPEAADLYQDLADRAFSHLNQ